MTPQFKPIFLILGFYILSVLIEGYDAVSPEYCFKYLPQECFGPFSNEMCEDDDSVDISEYCCSFLAFNYNCFFDVFVKKVVDMHRCDDNHGRGEIIWYKCYSYTIL